MLSIRLVDQSEWRMNIIDQSEVTPLRQNNNQFDGQQSLFGGLLKIFLVRGELMFTILECLLFVLTRAVASNA